MKTQRIWRGMALVALSLVLTGGAVHGGVPPGGNPCVVPANTSGTVDLPPSGCGYVSPDQLHILLDGLPDGTTVVLDASHHKFFCRQGPGKCTFPGGPLNGEVEEFDSLGTFQLKGTGKLDGWSRTINIPLKVRTATAKRTPGDPVQRFATDMLRLEGSITGDPDFDLLEIVGGTENGLPSPGQTTLTLEDGAFRVESNFQVGYKIRFIGTPEGRLKGYSGSTSGSVNMGTGQPDPCGD